MNSTCKMIAPSRFILKSSICAVLFSLSGITLAQTNTFPSTGNVGIGTTSPTAKLSFNNVSDDTSDGITWHNPDALSYGIFRTSGSWTHPNYQQLRINFLTGIILNPGSAYGKSFVDIQGGGLRVSSGNVGIGISSPVTKLDLNGSFQIYPAANAGANAALKLRFLAGPSATILEANSDFVWANHDVIINAANGSSGNVDQLVVHRSNNIGIGTRLPANRLHVSSSNAVDRIAIQGTLTNSNVGFMIMNQDGTERWSIASVYDRNFLQFYCPGYGNVMVLHNDGNVGIGTTTPSEKLTVNGTIYGKEIKVDLSVPGPDYVFERDYDLLSLQEVEDFITRKKHLPDVPSAKEMEANGIELAEMNMLLLKKIEELTLYVIELKKENAQIKERLSIE